MPGMNSGIERVAYFLLLLLPLAVSADRHQLAPEQFAQLPALQKIDLSHNGSMLSFVRSVSDAETLVVADLLSDNDPWLVSDPDWFFLWVDWISDHELLVGLSQPLPWDGKSYSQSRTLYLDARSRKSRQLLKYEDSGPARQHQSSVIHSSANSPEQILIVNRRSRFGTVEVFSISATTLKLPSQSLPLRKRDMWSWFADAEGNVRSGLGYKRTTTDEILLVRGKNAQWYDVSDRRNSQDLNIMSCSTLDQDVCDATLVTEERRRVFGQFHASTGEFEEVPEFRKDADVWRVSRTVDGKAVSTVDYEDGSTDYHEPILQTSYLALAASFPDERVRIAAFSKDRSRLIVSVGQVNSPRVFYLYDPNTRKLEKIDSNRPALQDKTGNQTRLLEITSSDGVGIPVDMVLPESYNPEDADRLPFVIIPNDGTQIFFDHFFYQRDRYDPVAEMLANQGIGVLKVYYRGVKGFGANYEHLGYHQAAERIVTDVHDAARYLVDAGFADSARICLLGNAFGANIALREMQANPAMYRCAVSLNGLTNLKKLMADIGSSDHRSLRYGDPWRDRDRLRDASAYYSDAAITVPTLLIHAEYDTVIPVRQSRRFARKFRSDHLSYLEVSEADRSFRKQSDNLMVMQSLSEFLGRHLQK